MEKLFNEMEELLIGDEGIVMLIRYGDGLDAKKASFFLELLDIYIDNCKLSNEIPKIFFLLMLDCITSINSCIEINEDRDEISIFSDDLTDKLRNI